MREADSATSPWSPSRSSEQCPQLHVLVVGERGTGKTTLVNHALGPESEFQITTTNNESVWIAPGRSSMRNPRLVMHELSYDLLSAVDASQAHDVASVKTIEIVQHLLKENTAGQALMNQIHVIWFCIQGVPSSMDNRVLRASDREFLMLQRVPQMIVFTQSDVVVAQWEEANSNLPNTSAETTDAHRPSVQRAAESEFLGNISSYFRTGGLKNATLDPESNRVIRSLLETTCQLGDDYVERMIWEAERTRISADYDFLRNTIAKALEIVMDVYYRGAFSNIPWHTQGNMLDQLHRTLTRIWKMDDPRMRRDAPPFVSQVYQLSTAYNVHHPESDKTSWTDTADRYQPLFSLLVGGFVSYKSHWWIALIVCAFLLLGQCIYWLKYRM
ncbi:hypothetical protein MIND_00920100 [Mycena indigotica]|uniref:G domain-containing protein n=1 Tax=Mycena indigotica TaxID=2126181 RepID=A0A8H6W0B0_9AGAR|nr:uncharacterized protein MIND_00920100 [Mycena indigotica]KAF7296883.1 hypothetical protein MIND_00920100 [Mycena indigotica]